MIWTGEDTHILCEKQIQERRKDGEPWEERAGWRRKMRVNLWAGEVGVISLMRLGSRGPEGFSNWISNIKHTHHTKDLALQCPSLLCLITGGGFKMMLGVLVMEDLLQLCWGVSQMTHCHYYRQKYIILKAIYRCRISPYIVIQKQRNNWKGTTLNF